MWVLKRPDIVPPGSYPYEQREGIYKKFPAQSSIEAQVAEVLPFRIGNKLPRATKEETALDIILQQCERLGNMKEHCYDTEGKPYTNPISVPTSSCGSCGAKVK